MHVMSGSRFTIEHAEHSVDHVPCSGNDPSQHGGSPWWQARIHVVRTLSAYRPGWPSRL